MANSVASQGTRFMANFVASPHIRLRGSIRELRECLWGSVFYYCSTYYKAVRGGGGGGWGGEDMCYERLRAEASVN